jgi:hypothetical protein
MGLAWVTEEGGCHEVADFTGIAEQCCKFSRPGTRIQTFSPRKRPNFAGVVEQCEVSGALFHYARGRGTRLDSIPHFKRVIWVRKAEPQYATLPALRWTSRVSKPDDHAKARPRIGRPLSGRDVDIVLARMRRNRRR